MNTESSYLNKKITFGNFTHFKNLCEEYIQSDNKAQLLKDVRFFDIVFVITLKQILETKKRTRFLGGTRGDVLEMIKEEYEELKENYFYLMFEKNGFNNLETNIHINDAIREVKIKIFKMSITRVISLINYHYKMNNKINEDSLRRYFDFYDLILFNKDYIDFKNINNDFLKIDTSFFKIDMITTKERR